ncbi:PCMD domain-containing protein [Dysgonomonas sp. Marseille-P4361]|uniref:PCMD domain-containing protein n=1 Tax=Dysgonomonas sp. Marseille-P4361 TaxID=2161820 RepID=UPI000D5609A3|nr:PCMD domain-containing protein [Dysgonomonas sp. Marseille-P4361]
MKKIFKLFPLLGVLLISGLFIACNDDDEKSTEALILEMTFENEIVTVQPVVAGTDINFAVAHNATEEQLKGLVPIIKVSNGATVNPESGTAVDFTAETVEFVVTAEDGVSTTKYTASCKRSINTEAKILSMKFLDSDIVVGDAEIEDTNIIIPIKGNTSSSSSKLKKLIPTIEISDNATIGIFVGEQDEIVACEEGIEIDFSQAEEGNSEHKPVRFLVTAEDGVTQTIYSASYKKNTSTEAYLANFALTSSVITKDPVVKGASYLYEISNDATLDDLNKIIPTFEIPKYATVSPKLGAEIDLSKGPVVYTVTSGDGKTKATYEIIPWQNKFNFEHWALEGTAKNAANKLTIDYYAPLGNWSSSNGGANFLVLLGQVDKVVVTKTDDANSGTGAARIETIQSNKIDGTGAATYPVVTTGSLFIGTFKTDIINTLKSTKFGMIYDKKPTSVKGYYKYTPGSVFYRCPNPKSYNVVVAEPTTTDECAINAILYEVDEKGTYLTGVDAYDETKLTAIAKLKDGTKKEEYSFFDIDFEYIKPYDPNKTYRLAIICSSSKWGDTFSGAPGSVLYVDDIEIISE